MDVNATDYNSEAYREFALNEFNLQLRNSVMPVTVFIALESVVGFFGNILVIYVFWFKYKSCNFRYFVLCLAVVDLTSSLTTMPGEVYTQMHWYNYQSDPVCQLKSFLNLFTIISEALCLLVIAVDRYLKVCWPLGFQISTKMAISCCVIIYVIATIIGGPVAILWGLRYDKVNFMNTTITTIQCDIDELYKTKKDPVVYTSIVLAIISICLITMFVLYVLVARRLVKNHQEKKRSLKICPKISVSSSEGMTSTTCGKNYQEDSESKDTRNICNTTNKELSTTENDMVSDVSYEPDIGSSAGGSNVDKKDSGPVGGNKTGSRAVSRVISSGSRLSSRAQRKTLIMLILTVIFVVTTVVYRTCAMLIANKVLENKSDPEKSVFFFFYRLYFINHAINPIVYGFLDPSFKRAICICRK